MASARTFKRRPVGRLCCKSKSEAEARSPGSSGVSIGAPPYLSRASWSDRAPGNWRVEMASQLSECTIGRPIRAFFAVSERCPGWSSKGHQMNAGARNAVATSEPELLLRSDVPLRDSRSPGPTVRLRSPPKPGSRSQRHAILLLYIPKSVRIQRGSSI
jgi:hypothetical protein